MMQTPVVGKAGRPTIVATLSWPPAVAGAWMLYLYCRAARFEELILRLGPVAGAYGRYASRVTGFPFGKMNRPVTLTSRR